MHLFLEFLCPEVYTKHNYSRDCSQDFLAQKCIQKYDDAVASGGLKVPLPVLSLYTVTYYEANDNRGFIMRPIMKNICTRLACRGQPSHNLLWDWRPHTTIKISLLSHHPVRNIMTSFATQPPGKENQDSFPNRPSGKENQDFLTKPAVW